MPSPFDTQGRFEGTELAALLGERENGTDEPQASGGALSFVDATVQAAAIPLLRKVQVGHASGAEAISLDPFTPASCCYVLRPAKDSERCRIVKFYDRCRLVALLASARLG